MSTENAIRQVVSVDEQGFDESGEPVVDEDGFELVDETPQFRPAVEQEMKAKVDANHPDARPFGLTLEAEERLEAREWEIERTKTRFDARQESSREARTKKVAEKGSTERGRVFEERAGSVNKWTHPDEPDPRAQLSQEELAGVNEQAVRVERKLDGWTSAAISRKLAERVVDGSSLMSAVIGVFEALQTEPGRVVPIAALEEVRRQEVSIEGRVKTLWEPSHTSISQVGLVEDESGTVKVTVWKRSDAPWMQEGERVRIHGAARNWYEGRVSLAVTGWSTIHFSERGRWWE
ncbi:SOSS complex subunit B family protein [Halorarum halobium]|uniref:SOSS complex subunit B family protein n=1 Tax=Halorarum halobium TaxID=3075121 RepID=UPI0028AACC97|nr:OB-fold nucleic acid binding domain-containing protein [Halobaculum sp. XH14]